MKKSFIIIALALSVLACNKETQQENKEFKTAYVDTSKMMEEYTEAKDVQEKFKAKSEEEARKLEVQEANFKADVDYFQKNMQANGQAWAQQKGAELEKRQQQLQYLAQNVGQSLQAAHAKEMDTLVKSVKQFIKDYGKEKGYDYVYATGETVSILYAKDQYDITDEVIKLLNEKYKPAAKKEETAETTKEEAK